MDSDAVTIEGVDAKYAPILSERGWMMEVGGGKMSWRGEDGVTFMSADHVRSSFHAADSWVYEQAHQSDVPCMQMA